ncbi:methyl-accepting chemotaxis protein [Luteimonas sp. gir]|uniref:methyl-accepting chemotaxis protein n=1 Tax=Luteimonas sp. gir TaxID=3127960 RepID=UPI003075C6BA
MWIKNRMTQALSAAASAELNGVAPDWPKGPDAVLIRDLARQLRASRDETQAAQAQAAGMAERLKEALSVVQMSDQSAACLWGIPCLDTSNPDTRQKAWWSASYTRALGYGTSEELPATLDTWIDRIHEADKGRVTQDFSAFVKRGDGSAFESEHRLRMRDGAFSWFRVDARAIPTPTGGRAVAGTLRDITLQREHDQFLDTTLIRFELGAQMLNDGLWDMSVIAGDPINPNNEFWWSDQFRRLLGFASEAEFPNVLDSWASRLHPEDKERSLNAFAAHLSDRSGRTGFDIEYRLELKSGEYRWFRARGLTKRASDGTPLRAVGALLDIEANVQLAKVVESLTATSANLVSSNRDLSRRTEQQAAALEETASSMEEMTSTVQQNAEGATRASKLASEAAASADGGQEVVAGIVEVMKDIEASAGKISDIITVVDGIAFQTNILALNAAVEAARAGEQGRGFAVVASEVRSLAQRCAAAAKEIKALITTSGEQVARGSAQSRAAGERINGLKGMVIRLDEIVAEIAAASAEQNSGIAQINHSVIQMDTMTQQNAALVEEMAASVEEMNEQAQVLAQSVKSSSNRAA